MRARDAVRGGKECQPPAITVVLGGTICEHVKEAPPIFAGRYSSGGLAPAPS